ncbi:MAG: hypothetical protein F9K32_18990 [Desulfobulbaceae bacterium]|nr:MAG: hypothetical protein F9K32_18990 [Desulfobulbaceae bacterium]
MDNLNIVEILKVGLPGLVFLLSMFSYRLLAKEQEKEHPKPAMLNSIKRFMNVNIILAVLTLVSPLADRLWGVEGSAPETEVFDVEAIAGSDLIEAKKAGVCQNAPYKNRYLLIKDKTTNRLIQVFAGIQIPCKATQQIALSGVDTVALGWNAGTRSGSIEVVPALPGYMFPN